MFAAHCEAEGCTVLLTTRRITDLRVEPERVTIAFTCWCGHEGVVVDHRTPAGGPRTDDTGEPSTRDRTTAARPTATPDRRAEPAAGRVPTAAAA